MRFAIALLATLAAPAAAQPETPLGRASPAGQGGQGGWQPAAAYVTPGQDEPGYRSWYIAAPDRAARVKAFSDYLTTWGVGGVVPSWQLLRTASSWERCGAQPFEVPPTSEWPHIVQTLRYIHAHVVPTVGPVEAVSAYRNPLLNACAGGAPESAHKHYSAIDLVPLQPTSREQLMRSLCRVHARRGTDYEVGLGFYAFLRFHVDTTRFRRWGADPGAASCPPIIRPADVASVGPAYQPTPSPLPNPMPVAPPTAAEVGPALPGSIGPAAPAPQQAAPDALAPAAPTPSGH